VVIGYPFDLFGNAKYVSNIGLGELQQNKNKKGSEIKNSITLFQTVYVLINFLYGPQLGLTTDQHT